MRWQICSSSWQPLAATTNGLGTTYTQNDFNIWRAHFGQTAVSGSAGYTLGASAEPLSAIPEPTSVSLFAVAVLLAIRDRRVVAKNRC